MAQSLRNTIRFLLDDELVELSDFDPNRTVLQWLREDRTLSGSKEGCAEGDCGACAIVIAQLSPDGESVEYRALNSCIQFLPTLDGKKLLTVESLPDGSGKLHPVQQAMVEEHGSQCGFCTPGFVMSLYAAYQNNTAHNRREIDDTLAGNLCRCTGYRPIIAAAKRMYELDQPPRDDSRVVQQLRQLKTASLEVGNGAHNYFAPTSLQELSDLALRFPQAQLLAGGTDIGLWVTKEYQALETLIYLGSIAELKTIQQSKTHLEIGAAVTFSDAIPVLLEHYPQLDELLHRFAGPPIRNAATLGGNIANASPIGDSMPVLIAMNTLLVLRKGGQVRELPLDEFFLAYQKTALCAGEFIERIRIPLPGSTTQLATYKISKRFDQDISAVCAAFSLTLAGSRVERMRIAYGGMAAIPARAFQCEQSLVGAEWNEATVLTACQALEQDFTPISDMRASKEYRMQVSQNLLMRFYHATQAPADAAGIYRYGS